MLNANGVSKEEFLEYKGKPLVRNGNDIYYGDLSDKYHVFMMIMSEKNTAKGIEMINNANPGQGVISIKSLEALEKLANGRSTKIIVPSNIQGMAGLATSLVESVKDPE